MNVSADVRYVRICVKKKKHMERFAELRYR